jgi:hypothetical protein
MCLSSSIHPLPSPTSTSTIPISSQPITAPTPASRIRNRQSIAPSTTHHTASASPPTIHPLRRKPLQPPRQIHAPKVRNTNRRARPSTQYTIQQRARIYMSPIPAPTRRQRRTRIPPYSKTQRQRVSYRNLRISSMRRHRVCSSRINRTRRRRFRRRMHQQIHIIPHMQMAQLQCA